MKEKRNTIAQGTAIAYCPVGVLNQAGLVLARLFQAHMVSSKRNVMYILYDP